MTKYFFTVYYSHFLNSYFSLKLTKINWMLFTMWHFFIYFYSYLFAKAKLHTVKIKRVAARLYLIWAYMEAIILHKSKCNNVVRETKNNSSWSKKSSLVFGDWSSKTFSITQRPRRQKVRNYRRRENICGKSNGIRWYRLRIDPVYF